VVIVGGSSGIGLAVAEEAASHGAEVVIVSSKAERVQEAIKSTGREARGEAVDVSDEKAVESFFTNLGAFDHLVFTAGDTLQLHELADTDLKRARGAFELRYWSALATGDCIYDVDTERMPWHNVDTMSIQGITK
jgi:NAD(P)-dependent dehydrogenase (short-subunit alcohol dehydrogenase family)